MKKIILFDVNCDYYDFEKWPIEGLDIKQTLMYNPKISWRFIKILRNIGFGVSRVSLNNWFSEKRVYDLAIIPDATVNINILKVLYKYPQANTQILYYRNRVCAKDLKKIEYAKEKGYILATYSKEDAELYDMKFIPQCWNRMYIKEHSDKAICNDVYFVGEVKNRYELVMDIKKACETNGLSTLFQIISDKDLPFTQTQRVPYTDVVENILSSRAVLDIVTKENWGLTIRPLEALMSKRKVITNYTSIKEYDFYTDNINNIFILGERPIEELASFINRPFNLGTGIIYNYDTEAWIYRMVDLCDYEH